MALRDVLFVAEDFDVSPDEAAGDASPAVYVGAFHDDCVLYLCVADGCVVSYACVGADVCVRADLTVVSDDGGAADGCLDVDDGSPAYPHWVILSGRILDSAMIVGVEVVEDELVCLQEVLGPPRVLLQALYLLDVDFCSFAYV